MAVTRDGIPVRVWCWPGGTGDSKPVQVEDLVVDQPSRGPGVPAELCVLAQHVGYRGHRGQRSPQLMGHVAGEPPRPLPHPLQFADLVLKRAAADVFTFDNAFAVVESLRINGGVLGPFGDHP